MFYIAYGLIAFLLWVVGQAVYNVYLHPLRAIPGPTLAKLSRWWLFRLEMRGNPHLEILALHRTYGPILRISPNEVSFNDLEASAVIYGPTSKFEKSEYFYRAFEDRAPNLFTIRNRQHHAQDKRLLSHAFSRANIMHHEPSIYDKATYLMDRISQRITDNQMVPLFPAFRCMTLDTLSEFAFGRSTGALQVKNFESPVFDPIDKATHSVPFFQHFPLLRELLRLATEYNITAVPNGFLDLAQAASAGFDQMHTTDTGTWTMFKNMISSAENKSMQLTKEHLISEGMVMIVAGTDTTAATLALTLHHLLQQPQAYQRLQDEVRIVLASVDSRPSIQELDSLPYLDACIKEGLRISCPSRMSLPRTVPAEGWRFGGYYLPPGTEVSMSPLYLLYDEKVFPSPASYNPDRWLVDNERKAEVLAYFHPFSRGMRQCIGQNLSMIEQKIVLSMFVRRFSPGQVLKKSVRIQEAITIIVDPVEVRVDFAAG